MNFPYYCNTIYLIIIIIIAVCSMYELPRTAQTRCLCNITNLPHVKHNPKCITFVNNATKSLTRS